MELESKRVVSFILDAVIDSVVSPIDEEPPKSPELEVFNTVKNLLEELIGNFPLPGSRNDTEEKSESFFIDSNDFSMQDEGIRDREFSKADEEIHEESCHQMLMHDNGDDDENEDVEENGDDEENKDIEENGDDEENEDDEENGDDEESEDVEENGDGEENGDDGEVSTKNQNKSRATQQECFDYLQLVPNNQDRDDNQDFVNFTEVEFYHKDVVKTGNKPDIGCFEAYEGQERDNDKDVVGFQTVPISEQSDDVGGENIAPLLVNKESLFSATNQSDQENYNCYAGKKRKHEEEKGTLGTEIIYHTLCGVAMPNLLNAVPRLGLSKNSKLPKLHQM